ncbi:MAG: hypothetical protein M3Y87_28690, partial [Myxococcota bacterium]|nr:hypothetical protein [Myxococcota bacterium]
MMIVACAAAVASAQHTGGSGTRGLGGPTGLPGARPRPALMPGGQPYRPHHPLRATTPSDAHVEAPEPVVVALPTRSRNDMVVV